MKKNFVSIRGKWCDKFCQFNIKFYLPFVRLMRSKIDEIFISFGKLSVNIYLLCYVSFSSLLVFIDRFHRMRAAVSRTSYKIWKTFSQNIVYTNIKFSFRRKIIKRVLSNVQVFGFAQKIYMLYWTYRWHN